MTYWNFLNIHSLIMSMMLQRCYVNFLRGSKKILLIKCCKNSIVYLTIHFNYNSILPLNILVVFRLCSCLPEKYVNFWIEIFVFLLKIVFLNFIRFWTFYGLQRSVFFLQELEKENWHFVKPNPRRWKFYAKTKKKRS